MFNILVGFQLFCLDPDEDTKVWYHTVSSSQKRKLNPCQNQRTSSLFVFFGSCVVLEPLFTTPVPPRCHTERCLYFTRVMPLVSVLLVWSLQGLMEWLLLLSSTQRSQNLQQHFLTLITSGLSGLTPSVVLLHRSWRNNKEWHDHPPSGHTPGITQDVCLPQLCLLLIFPGCKPASIPS